MPVLTAPPTENPALGAAHARSDTWPSGYPVRYSAAARFNHRSQMCVRDAKQFVDEACRKCGFPDEICDSAAYCAFELASNCREHAAYPAGRDTFGVRVRWVWQFLGVGFLAVQFSDPDGRLPVWGRTDPLAAGEPDVHALDEGVRFGGWGLCNVESVTDGLAFWRTRWGKCGRFLIACPSGSSAAFQ